MRDHDFSDSAYTAKGWHACFGYRFDQGENDRAARRRMTFDEAAR